MGKEAPGGAGHHALGFIYLEAGDDARARAEFSADLGNDASCEEARQNLAALLQENTRLRDYPVVFGTLFIFTLLGLIVKLIGDITYTLVDPRIDFESREG